jgi:hypothetical protein
LGAGSKIGITGGPGLKCPQASQDFEPMFKGLKS